jgi:integrase
MKVNFRTVSGRKLPHGAFWVEDGKRRSKYFATEKERKAFAKTINSPMDPAFQEWIELRRRTEGIPLQDILNCWETFGKGSGGEFVESLIEPFKEEKWALGVCADVKTQYKNHLERFRGRFGKRRMDTVTPTEIFKWLQSLPYAPVTRKNHRRTIKGFYNWASDRGHCRTNPAKIVKDEAVVTDIEIMSVEDCRKLFEANVDSPAIGRLALEAFGLLRYSSAKRLRPQDINWEERGITLPAAQLKTSRRTYVDAHPDNLWGWLHYAPKECWTMSERIYQAEKRYMFIRSGVKHPKNVLRHSACTYHYAAFKNPGLTASLMAHTNLRTMEQFYRGRATQSDGVAYFEIYHPTKKL